MERLGPVVVADDIRAQLESACGWVRRLRKDGADWSPLPSPSVPELWPNAGESEWPWHEVTSRIALELNELTQLWYVGPDKRDLAHTKGITSWKDPRVTASSLGVAGNTTGPTLKAILDINQTQDGPSGKPAHVSAAEGEWRPVPKLEFFVDFETVNNVSDDFSKIPQQSGQNLIFMIGCGHVHDGEWVFRCFTIDRLNEVSEAEILEEWLAHMSAVNNSLGGMETPAHHPLVICRARQLRRGVRFGKRAAP